MRSRCLRTHALITESLGLLLVSTATDRSLYKSLRMSLWRAMQTAAPQAEQGEYTDPPQDLPPPLDMSDWDPRAATRS